MGFSTISCLFNGVNGYVTAGNILDYERTDAFSFSLWFKTIGTSIAVLIAKQDAATSDIGYGLRLTAGGAVDFTLTNTPDTNELNVQSVTGGYNDRTWHHLCLTYDGLSGPTGVKIYVDGINVGTTTVWDTLSATISHTADFQLGAYDGSNDPYDGILDEVAVYDKELSSVEAAWLYAAAIPTDLADVSAPSNLVAWWRMGEDSRYPLIRNEATGSAATYPTIFDESGNGNDGTMTGMLASNIQAVVPWSNFSQYSYSFDGSNEYLTFGDVTAYDYDTPFSVSLWLKFTAAGSQDVVSKMGASTAFLGWTVSTDSGGQILFILSNDAGSSLYSAIITDDGFNDDEWHHVVCSYTAVTPGAAADMSIFVDGVAVATTVMLSTLGSNSITNTASLNFATYNDSLSGTEFAGWLSDVAIYSQALNLTEAQWIYNGGEPRDLRLPTAPSDLAGYWRLGEANEIPQAGWPHKVQQWVWAATTKESTTITDASHLDSPGTLYNMAAGDVTTDTPGGISDYSCTFDGISKSMYCNVATGFYGPYNFLNQSPLSLAGWVKCSASTSGWLWGNGTNSLLNWAGYGVQLVSGKPEFVFTPNYSSGANGLIVRTTTVTVDDGDWHHVLVCYRYSTALTATLVDIYIDGVSVATTVVHGASASSITGGGFSIGARNAGGHEPVAAQCDEVAAWSKFLTQADATALYNGGAPTDLREHKPTIPFLQGWWRLGDPYLAPGTAVNMELIDKIPTAPGLSTYTERSLYFNGGNDYLLAPHDSAYDFDIADPFSVSGWICPLRVSPAFAGFFAKGTSGAHWKIEYYGRYNLFQGAFCRIMMDASVAGYIELYIGGSLNARCLPQGQWMHLVVTYDGSNDADNIKAYINGEEWPTWVRYNIAMAGTMQNSSDLWMGRASAYWQGYQDEMSIWSKELTQADVTELWNDGDPAHLWDHSSVEDLAGWWRMGEGGVATMVNMDSGDLQGDVPTLVLYSSIDASRLRKTYSYHRQEPRTEETEASSDRDMTRYHKAYSFTRPLPSRLRLIKRR